MASVVEVVLSPTTALSDVVEDVSTTNDRPRYIQKIPNAITNGDNAFRNDANVNLTSGPSAVFTVEYNL